jgi:hypothetical protein
MLLPEPKRPSPIELPVERHEQAVRPNAAAADAPEPPEAHCRRPNWFPLPALPEPWAPVQPTCDLEDSGKAMYVANRIA